MSRDRGFSVPAGKPAPTFRSGCARSGAESEYPELWEGLDHAYVFGLGQTGSRLHDFGSRKSHGVMTNFSTIDSVWRQDSGRMAGYFSGSNNYVTVSSSASRSRWSLSVWVWVGPSIASTPVIAKFGSHAFQYLNSSGNTILRYYTGTSYDSSFTFARSCWNHLGITHAGDVDGLFYYYLNGVLRETKSPGHQAQPAIEYIGYYASSDHYMTGMADDLLVYNRPLGQGEMKILGSRRGVIFEPRRRRGFLSVAGGGSAVSGDLSITEADDTLSATVAVTVTASESSTEANDAVAGTASAIVGASLAATEANDAASSAAAVQVAAAASITEADDSLSSAGAVAAVAAASVTESDDSLSSELAVGVAAAASATEANDTLAAAAGVQVAAALARTEANDTASSAAVAIAKADVSITEENDTLSTPAGHVLIFRSPIFTSRIFGGSKG